MNVPSATHDPLERLNRETTTTLAVWSYLDAARPDKDPVLYELAREARQAFAVESCIVGLVLGERQHVRVWDGEIPAGAERTLYTQGGMGEAVVEGMQPVVVPDLRQSTRFNQRLADSHGLRFYAGVPLITSDGQPIGSLSLLDAQPQEVREEQLLFLGAYARAVVARLEALGAIEREVLRGRELRRLLDASSDMIAVLDPDGMIRSISPACRAILGYQPHELVRRNLRELVHPDDRAGRLGQVQARRSGTTVVRKQERWLRKDGEFVWVESTATSLFEEQEVYCVVRDITESKLAEQRLQESEQRYGSLFEHNPIAVFTTDRAGRFLSANTAGERITGHKVMDWLGRPFVDMVAPKEKALVMERFAKVLEGRPQTMNLTILDSRLQEMEMETWWMPMIVNGQVAGIIGVSQDVTARNELADRLEWQAFHDPLTGLRNRTWFMNRFEGNLAVAEQTCQGILFLDLDNFKRINDSFGHEAGDQLLIQFADRLRRCLGEAEVPVRLGGDEFIVMLGEGATERTAIAVAERIASALTTAFTLGEQEVFMTVSIGVAIRSKRHQEPADLLRDADVAVYWAKNQGKASCALFEPRMNLRSLERVNLETDLRRALQREEFRVHYQPVVNLQTGQVDGVEALVRWQHPQRGLVPPGEFIPLAEETGLILPLGRWVLEEACRQLKQWHAMRPNGPWPFVSVNLSPRQFQQPELVEQVASVLRQHQLPTGALKLEITENVVLGDLQMVIATMEELRGLGVQLALDDFGTGYSSLNHLRRLPVGTLKIAGSFMEGLGERPEAAAIVKSIVGLAKTLNMMVTCEGVEHAEQLALLRTLGCDRVQGYYLARPMPAEAVETLLERRLPDRQL